MDEMQITSQTQDSRSQLTAGRLRTKKRRNRSLSANLLKQSAPPLRVTNHRRCSLPGSEPSRLERARQTCKPAHLPPRRNAAILVRFPNPHRPVVGRARSSPPRAVPLTPQERKEERAKIQSVIDKTLANFAKVQESATARSSSRLAMIIIKQIQKPRSF